MTVEPMPGTEQQEDAAKLRALLEIKRARLARDARDAMDEHLRLAEQALGL